MNDETTKCSRSVKETATDCYDGQCSLLQGERSADTSAMSSTKISPRLYKDLTHSRVTFPAALAPTKEARSVRSGTESAAAPFSGNLRRAMSGRGGAATLYVRSRIARCLNLHPARTCVSLCSTPDRFPARRLFRRDNPFPTDCNAAIVISHVRWVRSKRSRAANLEPHPHPRPAPHLSVLWSGCPLHHKQCRAGFYYIRPDCNAERNGSIPAE